MPLPAIAIPMIAQGATSLAQTVGGLIGRNKAQKEFENAEVPNYFDTEAYKTAQSSANQAYRYAQEGLPEASRRFQEDMIGRSGATALATTGSLRSGIAGVGATAQSLADQYRQLASMDANQRIANRGTYFNQLNNLQTAQNVQADREYGNFLNKQASRLAEMSAGRDTMNAGIAGLGKAATLGFQAGITPKMFGGLQGRNKSGDTTMNPMNTIPAGPIGTTFSAGPFGMMPSQQMGTIPNYTVNPQLMLPK